MKTLTHVRLVKDKEMNYTEEANLSDLNAQVIRVPAGFHDLKLTDPRAYLQPRRYPEAYTMAEDHRRMNWTREEVRTLHEDVADWKAMTEEERAPRQFLLNYFTQADVDVAASYFDRLAKHYTQPELRMVLARIIDREMTHVDCYDMLPDQFGIPRIEYSEMLAIDEVAEQREFMLTQQFAGEGLVERLADLTTHICGEGVGIYGIFLMLLNDSRFGRMKALGQEVVSWSGRDENDHCYILTWFFNKELEENPEFVNSEAYHQLRQVIIEMFLGAVQRGVAYAKAVYEKGELPELTVEDVETFLKQLANIRIKKLNMGFEKLFPELPDTLVLDWASDLFAGSMDNFFETAGTNYQIGAMTGEWKYPEGEYIKDSHLLDKLMNG